MAVYALGALVPTIGVDVFIAPDAAVIGDVTLGDGVSIWFNAVLRGDCYPIRVGARTNIQDGSVVHVTGGKAETVLGADITVGHKATIHGCVVEDAVLVGMGSIILDGAVIGAESIVAAGSLVPPGMIVPPRSLLMGRPAKVVRKVEDADLSWTREAARLYLGYSADFRNGLRLIDR